MCSRDADGDAATGSADLRRNVPAGQAGGDRNGGGGGLHADWRVGGLARARAQGAAKPGARSGSPGRQARAPSACLRTAGARTLRAERAAVEQPPPNRRPPREAAAAEIVREPPDPFPQDLLETRQRLQAIESRDMRSEPAPPDGNSDALWRGEIAKLRSLLSVLDPPSSKQPMPKRPSETPSSLPKDQKR